MKRALTAVVVAMLVAGMLGHLACAVSHGTGHRSAEVAGDREEMALGKAADSELRREQGIYAEKPALTEYVSAVGMRLTEKSGRPDLTYVFTIVNAPELDALALPGGFIYVTRGLLDRMNSEDELAAVLGHEIAHVAERHAATQLSKISSSRPGQAGLSVLSDPGNAIALAQLTDLALTLARQGYPADDERRADDLGAAYAERAGYNPVGAMRILEIFRHLAEDDPGRVASFFASHPAMRKRIAGIPDELRDMKRRYATAFDRPVLRDVYLGKVDGLALGRFGEAGFLSKNRYFDRRRNLSIAVPEGWSASLGEGERPLIMAHPAEGYGADLSFGMLTRIGTSIDVARAYTRLAQGEGLEVVGRVTTATIPAGQAAIVQLRGTDGRGRRVEVRKAFLVRLDQQIVLTFSVPEGKLEATQQAFMDLSGTIKYLLPAEIEEHADRRLALYRAKSGDTWDSIATQEVRGSATGARLAAYNGYEDKAPPTAGLLVKVPSENSLVPLE